MPARSRRAVLWRPGLVGLRLPWVPQPPLHTVVLDLEGVDFVDSQGTEAVGKLFDLGGAAGIELRLARVKGPVAEMLERDGVIARLGEGRVFATVYEAVADLIPREAS